MSLFNTLEPYLGTTISQLITDKSQDAKPQAEWVPAIQRVDKKGEILVDFLKRIVKNVDSKENPAVEHLSTTIRAALETMDLSKSAKRELGRLQSIDILSGKSSSKGSKSKKGSGKDAKAAGKADKSAKAKLSKKGSKDEKEDVAVTIHKRGLINLGSSCYWNSLLQIMARTTLLDYIIKGPIHDQESVQDGERLKKLQEDIDAAVLHLRTPGAEPLKREVLKGHIDQLFACKMIPNTRYQQDSTLVFDNLCTRFGVAPETSLTQFLHYSPNHPESDERRDNAEKVSVFALRVDKKGKSTSELLQKHLGKRREPGYHFPGTISFKIQNMPQFLNLRFNRLEVRPSKKSRAKPVAQHPKIEERIDLRPFLANAPQDGSSTTCALEAILMRSGAQKDNSGGHNWAIIKEGATYTRFNDGIVTENLTFDQIQKELNEFAYKCFYTKA